MRSTRLTSIRTRLTAWYSAVLGALVVAFAVGSFLVIREVLSRRADRFLRDVVATFCEEVRKESAAGADVRIVVRDELLGYRFREIDFLVLDADSVVGRSPMRAEIARSPGDEDVALDVVALGRALRERTDLGNFTLADEEGGFRVASERLDLAPVALTVAAVQSWHGYSETLELIRTGFFIIVPLLLLLSVVVGYWLTARSLAPVAAMSRKAASIGRDSLGQRLVAANPNDELGQLAGVFNGMLGRLEDSFARQQQFMQDASHELRSPVAAVRMEAEVTLRNERRSAEEYRDALAAIHHSAIRLTRIVDDLFFLARHDAKHPPPDSALIDLGETVHDAVRSLRPLALSRSIGLELADAPEAPVHGSAADLQRLTVNLVENALKHAPRGSTVRVAVAREAEDAFAVRVHDEGPGISVEARLRIFDRFFRVPSREGHATEGAGLGLPIARALAEKHGGRLELESSTPAGSTFVFVIPRATSATHPDDSAAPH